ncbi:DNA replication/repair protein RecF, partial [Candidatus Gracilibacteria bacterium]|nr:DNA replication/repair protein RecF [Candidatus Gracilibacteria bacterium]
KTDLGPSLRRDFLDETLILSDIVFGKIKSDYLKILKNRNKVLKNIFEKNTTKRELIFWDNAFIEISLKYYDFRKRFIIFIEENIKIIEDMLKNKYKLKFIYETKVDLDNISNSISNYLEKNLDRDILLGYTYIGPHLDNFYFNVIIGNKSYKAENYLSHGENKSILIGLKFLQIAFIQQYNKTDIILLLDDIFSELDKDHIILVMEKCNNYQSFITVQNIPNFLDNNDKIKTINL